jgi:hypothetical protein
MPADTDALGDSAAARFGSLRTSVTPSDVHRIIPGVVAVSAPLSLSFFFSALRFSPSLSFFADAADVGTRPLLITSWPAAAFLRLEPSPSSVDVVSSLPALLLPFFFFVVVDFVFFSPDFHPAFFLGDTSSSSLFVSISFEVVIFRDDVVVVDVGESGGDVDDDSKSTKRPPLTWSPSTRRRKGEGILEKGVEVPDDGRESSELIRARREAEVVVPATATAGKASAEAKGVTGANWPEEESRRDGDGDGDGDEVVSVVIFNLVRPFLFFFLSSSRRGKLLPG